jgi:hypothetical protein
VELARASVPHRIQHLRHGPRRPAAFAAPLPLFDRALLATPPARVTWHLAVGWTERSLTLSSAMIVDLHKRCTWVSYLHMSGDDAIIHAEISRKQALRRSTSAPDGWPLHVTARRRLLQSMEEP